MSAAIHPSAQIGKRVEIGDGCEIGPYCIVEDDVTLGKDNRLIAHVCVGSHTVIGAGNTVYPFTTLGMPPQDLKFGGEVSRVEIGDFNTIREQVTVHRGTAHGGGATTVGHHNLLMVSSHVAHDCHVGDHTILSHGCTLAGHVDIGDHATVGAYSGVHQFCRAGAYAFIGGFSVVTKDALPYIKSVGNRAKIYGINTIGLERKGFTREELLNLRGAYRTLFQKGLRLQAALQQIRADYPDCKRVAYLADFIAGSQRGIVR